MLDGDGPLFASIIFCFLAVQVLAPGRSYIKAAVIIFFHQPTSSLIFPSTFFNTLQKCSLFLSSSSPFSHSLWDPALYPPYLLVTTVLAAARVHSATPAPSHAANPHMPSVLPLTLRPCLTPKQSNSNSLSRITSALNIALDPVEGSVGLGCSPISVIGTGSGAVCNQEPVCCSGNTYVRHVLPYFTS